MKKSSLIPGLASLGFFLLAIPVSIAIIFAIWLAAAAAYENVKFVRSTDQLLTVIGLAREDAGSDTEFGSREREDIIDDLVRRAQIMNAPVNNWGGAVRAVMLNPPYMRVETDVPVRACRRLALFFGKDANALKLVRIDAHQDNGVPIMIYDNSKNNPQGFDYRNINNACGDGSYSTFALTVGLR